MILEYSLLYSHRPLHSSFAFRLSRLIQSSRFKEPQIRKMDWARSDLLAWYKLETEFFSDHFRHTNYVREAKARNEKMREDWSNCGELGKGGSGVVYRQIEKNTGRYGQ